LIGTALQREARQQGWDVTVLSRKHGQGRIVWDPQQNSIDIAQPRSFDAIINLAGTSIADGRWTAKRKKEIAESRVHACQTLELYLNRNLLQTPVYIGVSAIGIYGDRGSDLVDERTPISSNGDWMVTTVQDWEAGHQRIGSLGIRTVVFRIGIVLSAEGGALREILQTSWLGVLAYFGSGRQIWPWIHIEDVAGMMMVAIQHDTIQGTYQASSPQPVSNKELTIAASRQYTPRRFVVSIPVLILSVMLGTMHQMLMQSCNAFPARLRNEGYIFRHASLSETLQNLIKK
jgi:uncharacterized protein (TIGR01777 family)